MLIIVQIVYMQKSRVGGGGDQNQKQAYVKYMYTVHVAQKSLFLTQEK